MLGKWAIAEDMLIRLQDQTLIVHEGKDILIPDLKVVAAYAEAD